eukprot:COSAG02_NODE_1877_length_10559_cov_8.819025_8_plen_71_part_00
MVLAARRLGGGSSGDKGSCIGRLVEATEIATMEDKMLMEEVLINTGRTSAYAERIYIYLLLNRPAMCGST